MHSPNIEYVHHPSVEFFPAAQVGQRLVLVGESSSGPLYEPTIVYNLSYAESIFGYGPLLERYKDILHINDTLQVAFVRLQEHDFDKVYQALLPYPFDLIYIDDFQFGDSIENIDAFIEFAQQKENLGELIHGFFDIDVKQDLSAIEDIVSGFTFEDLIDEHELGKYISLVFDQVEGHKGAAIYASLITTLEPGVSPVNKPLDVVLNHEWMKEELKIADRIGIVAFRDSFHHGVVCANATCAVQTPESSQKHIGNFRIAQYLIQELSNAFQERIGQVQNNTQMEMIHSIVEEKLEEYMSLERIRAGEYAIVSNRIEGKIFIHLNVVPIFSTKYITAHSQVRIFR